MLQDLTVAPDGSFAIYERRTIRGNRYLIRLWRVDLDGGAPEPLTTGTDSCRHPRISPDGRSVLFLSERSGRTRPYVMPASGGAHRAIPAPATEVHGAEWLPGGSSVILRAGCGRPRFIVGNRASPTARRITDLTWRADGVGVRDEFVSVWWTSRGGRPRRLTPADIEVMDAVGTAPRGRVLFLADRRPNASLMEVPQIWSVTTGTAQLRLEAEPPGGAWALGSVRNGRLPFVGGVRAGAPLWGIWGLYVLEGGQVRRLGAELDRSVVIATYGDLIDPDAEMRRPVWIDDERIAALVSDRGRVVPFEFGVDGSVRPLAEGDIVCTALQTASGRVVVVANERGNAAELYEVDAGRLRQLTRHGSRWLAPVRVDPQAIEVTPSCAPGMDAWIVPARRSSRRGPGPTVVQIHGGPYNSHGPTPWLEMLALAGAGFTVLYANPRGSAGYGEEFARSIVGQWGGPDGEDVGRLVGWAVEAGLADPGRIGLLGLSYGGFMVLDLLGRHPNRFAAGVCENPVSDFVGFFGSSDIGWFVADRGAGLDLPPLDPGTWVDRSPWCRLHEVVAPVLLLQSEADLRCPPGQTDLAFAILRSLGRRVEMVRYPQEPHYMVGVGRPDRRVDRIRRIVEWFGAHL